MRERVRVWAEGRSPALVRVNLEEVGEGGANGLRMDSHVPMTEGVTEDLGMGEAVVVEEEVITL